MDLSLPLVAGHDSLVTLECKVIINAACLEKFTETECLGLSELYDCLACKKHQPATKAMSLTGLPPVQAYNVDTDFPFEAVSICE